MANQANVFKKDAFGSVRVIKLESGLWFVARDVALALGYSKSQVRHLGFIMAKVPNEHMGVYNIEQCTKHGVKSPFPLSVISLTGLRLFLNLKNAETKDEFLSWLEETIIPKMKGEQITINPLADRYLKNLDFAPESYEFLKKLYIDMGLSTKQALQAIDHVWQRKFGFSAITEANLFISGQN